MTSVTLRAEQYKVKENCVWGDGSSDDCGKQAVTVQTWRGVANCSKLDRRQPGKLGRRASTAAYVEPRRLPSGRASEVVGKVQHDRVTKHDKYISTFM